MARLRDYLNEVASVVTAAQRYPEDEPMRFLRAAQGHVRKRVREIEASLPP